jgi:Fe-S oxidoreductase
VVSVWPLYGSDGAAGGAWQWASIFARFGAKLESVSVGCCGMAGTYGHEVKNHANSLGIYELSWHQAMQRLPRNRCLATATPVAAR